LRDFKASARLLIPGQLQMKRVAAFVKTLQQGGRAHRGRIVEKGEFNAVKRLLGLPQPWSTKQFLQYLDENPQVRKQLEKAG